MPAKKRKSARRRSGVSEPKPPGRRRAEVKTAFSAYSTYEPTRRAMKVLAAPMRNRDIIDGVLKAFGVGAIAYGVTKAVGGLMPTPNVPYTHADKENLRNRYSYHPHQDNHRDEGGFNQHRLLAELRHRRRVWQKLNNLEHYEETGHESSLLAADLERFMDSMGSLSSSSEPVPVDDKTLPLQPYPTYFVDIKGEKLGAGMIGAVYRHKTNQKRAVKFSPQRDLIAEYSALLRLQDVQGVPKVYAYGDPNAHTDDSVRQRVSDQPRDPQAGTADAALEMQLMPGVSVLDITKGAAHYPRPTLRETLQFSINLLNIVDQMHCRHVGHRDLHHGNIMVEYRGHDDGSPKVSVIDFGQAVGLDKIGVSDKDFLVQNDLQMAFSTILSFATQNLCWHTVWNFPVAPLEFPVVHYRAKDHDGDDWAFFYFIAQHAPTHLSLKSTKTLLSELLKRVQ
jgi:hypothetical protein